MSNKKKQLFEEFMKTMTKIRRLMDQMSSMSLEDKVATMLQMQALTHLKDHSKLTVGELAAELHMSSSAIAQLTDRLVNAKLVMRSSDENDRRIVRLALTKKGLEELSTLHEKMMQKMSAFLIYLSEDDLNDMIRIHTKVLDKLEKK